MVNCHLSGIVIHWVIAVIGIITLQLLWGRHKYALLSNIPLIVYTYREYTNQSDTVY